MTNQIASFPVPIVKLIIEYSIIDKDEVEKLIDNIMLESAHIVRDRFFSSSCFKFTVEKVTQNSKNFALYIDFIGKLFGHPQIIDQQGFEMYKGPFFMNELSLIAYQTTATWTEDRNQKTTNTLHFLLRDLLQETTVENINKEFKASISKVDKDKLPKEHELDKSLIIPCYSAFNQILRKSYLSLSDLQELLLNPEKILTNRKVYNVFLKIILSN